jgi:predicted O-methyltransferase YrrM
MRDPVFFRTFDYDRSRLPNARLRELEEGVQSIDEARKRSGASIGYPGWTIIYSMLLGSLPPKRPAVLLETGTNQGASTIVLAQALADSGGGVVHSFEIDPDIQAIAKDNLEQAGLGKHAVFHLGDSRETVPAFLDTLEVPLDGVFLDGAHEAEVLLSEMAAVRPKLRRGALVFMDNTYPIAEPELGEPPRVNQALPILLERFGGAMLNLPFVSWYTPGLAIWQGELPLAEADWIAD